MQATDQQIPGSDTTVSGLTVEVDAITEAEWSKLLPEFDDATVYQTWSYGAICWGADQLSHLIIRQNGVATAIAQVRIIRVPLLGNGIAYIRWGPLWRRRDHPVSEETLQQVTTAIRQEYAERRGLLLRILPHAYQNDPFAQALVSRWTALGIRPNVHLTAYRTSRIDLTVSMDALRKKLHPRWRNYLKVAEKSGFTVVEGTSDEFYSRFIRLYREMMARKQFDTTVDIEEFRRMQQSLPDPLKLRIFLCEKDGTTMNALVVSAMGDTGIYLLAATGNEGLNLRGAHLLQWRAMLWLKEQKCHWYELGGINPDRNPGVYQFKSGLGGEEACHLGCYEMSENWMSTASVTIAERLQSAARRVRSAFKTKGA